jgi:hypothetical protein
MVVSSKTEAGIPNPHGTCNVGTVVKNSTTPQTVVISLNKYTARPM